LKLLVPDSSHDVSYVGIVVLTDAAGRSRVGVPVTIKVQGGYFGAGLGEPLPPRGQPFSVLTNENGALFKIYPEAPIVYMSAEALGYVADTARTLIVT
jgi:hypothetical protein